MDIDLIKKLRDETGAGVMEIKKALDEANGDVLKVKDILKAKGMEKAKKKSGREIKTGRIFAYVHNSGAIGAIVKLGCETDFVAKNKEFEKLGNEIAMQVVAMDPKDVQELLNQDYIRDPSRKIRDLMSGAVLKIKENITIEDFKRISV